MWFDGVAVGGRGVWRGRESTVREQAKSWKILGDGSSKSSHQEAGPEATLPKAFLERQETSAYGVGGGGGGGDQHAGASF